MSSARRIRLLLPQCSGTFYTAAVMRMTRLIPAGPVGGGPGRRRGGGGGKGFGLSVLLHVLALAGLLLLSRPRSSDGPVAPSYELVFEGPSGSAPPVAPEQGKAPPPSGQAPDSAPVAPAEMPRDQPPLPAAPSPLSPLDPSPPLPDPSLAGPQSPSPTVPPVPDTLPADKPPADAQAATAEPAIRLEVPPPLPSPTPLVPDVPMPLPPSPPPVPDARPAPPRPAAAPRPRTAPPPPGSFANPMDLSFNQTPMRGAERQAAPRTGARPGSVASRSMDLSIGTARASPNRSEAFFDARARNLGADWMQGVRQFWLRHRYYPRQAAENGEDGTVDLELTVDRTGRVTSAVVTSRSGSAWIDMAAVSTFRSAQLPPIPAELDAPYKTTLTINYLLIR